MEKDTFIKYLTRHDQLDEESLEAFKQLTEEHPWFQTGWMVYLKNLKTLDAEQFETVLKKVALIVPDRKKLYRFLNDDLVTPDSNEYGLHEANNAGSNSLIDKFLSKNPGSLRTKNSEPQQSENTENKLIIEKSVSEDSALITETLANIYFQQKNYEKALEAYQKLSLKYPEKSIYFASRIREIEELKHNN